MGHCGKTNKTKTSTVFCERGSWGPGHMRKQPWKGEFQTEGEHVCSKNIAHNLLIKNDLPIGATLGLFSRAWGLGCIHRVSQAWIKWSGIFINTERSHWHFKPEWTWIQFDGKAQVSQNLHFVIVFPSYMNTLYCDHTSSETSRVPLRPLAALPPRLWTKSC